MVESWTLIPAETETPTVPPIPPARTAATEFSVLSAVTDVVPLPSTWAVLPMMAVVSPLTTAMPNDAPIPAVPPPPTAPAI